MQPLSPFPEQKADPLYRLSERLPVGLRIRCIKQSVDRLDITYPAAGEDGMVLTFINYKGDLQIAIGEHKDRLQQVSPGLGLLSSAQRSLHFKADSSINFSAVLIFISREWINLFMKGNPNFIKIEQMLGQEENIVTCRLGRRQLSLFAAIINHKAKQGENLLEMQNYVLSLLEYFLCNRHRSLLGAHLSTGIENEDDLSLIKEVESYISEYYCSDSFTVDSILKKTYTSYHKLNFLFKSMHGMTISEYIRNKRIEKSKEMIAANAKSISQIAYEIGYSSISNYILAFKKVYQITPGKYKKQIGA
jgi:AraC-like DNA-binding protein